MSDTRQEAPQKTTVTITVDGRRIEAEPGELVIAAAERHGVYIPRFCYHPRMKPVGMCRMCLVEVDGPRGPSLQVSCMLPVAPDMVVHTESETTKKAQDGVLEFLLINHPLDCPVCDRGGECPLQDQTITHGPGESRFVEEKRHYEKPIEIGRLVLLDRERCILCDRCTRFASEVAGDPLISFVERGNQTQVLTFPDEPFTSYFSGNTVQICPVGALLASPYRFRARPWDLQQGETTCNVCAVGCRMSADTSRNRIVRFNGVDSDPVNQSWLCDKGRFSYEAVHNDDRLQGPLLREGDNLVPARWSDALYAAADAIRTAVERDGPASVAVLGGARLTNEDAYAWAKLAKGVIGTDSVDAQLGDGLPAELVQSLPRATIDQACSAGVLVLLAPDLKEELPVLYLRVRGAAADKGLRILELAPHGTGLTRFAAGSLRYRPGEAAALVRAVLGNGSASSVGLSDTELSAARALLDGVEDVVCVLGRPSLAESGASVAEAAAALLEGVPGVRFLSGLRRGNVQGALDMGLAPGLLPGRVTLEDGRAWFASSWPNLPAVRGMDATGVLTAAAEGRLGCLVLLGADPVADFPDRDLARRALAGPATVVAVDTLLTDSSRLADVVLAAATNGEKAGTTTNIEGRVSRVAQRITPPGTARADWQIAAELAWALDTDLGIERCDDIWNEIERLAPSHQGVTYALLDDPLHADGIVVPLGLEALDRPVMTGDPEGMSGGGAPQTAPPEIAEAHLEAGEGPAYAEEGAGRAAAAEASADAAQDDAGAGTTGPRTGYADPSGGSTVARPSMIRPAGRRESSPLVPLDAYSLRLVASRKLYDSGTVTQASPSLAPLAGPAAIRLSPHDFQRLGVPTGGQVRVSSSRTSVVLAAVADPAVPRGSAALWFNQPNMSAAELIDVTSPVTDVRVETI